MEPVRRAWHAAVRVYSIPNKIKILVGFYMIATKVEDVYEVYLPMEIRGALQNLLVFAEARPLEVRWRCGIRPQAVSVFVLP